MGRFTIGGLPIAGAYTISVAKDGFADAEAAHVQIIPGSSAIISFTLSAIGEPSFVTVKGTLTGLRVDQPQLGINLSREQIEDTPLLNRRITGLPLLNSANRPAINQGDIFMNQFLITTNGAGRRQAWFEVDGANSIDMWGRQTVFTNLPLMAVDEMAVLTNAFTPDFGGGTGSVVNIVTRSGSNDFHGQLLELWRPAGTEASLSGFTTTNAASGNDITSDILGQTAIDISGPLLSQKTHFFLAGEWNREAKASPVTSPLAPGTFVGHYRGWLGLLRLDHQINDTSDAFVRANFDDFTDTNPNGIVGGASLPTVARTFHRRTYSGELGETAALTPRLVNNLSHTLRINRPLDVDGPSPFIRTAQNQIRTAQAANCMRPYWVYFYAHNGGSCDPIKNAGPVPLYGLIQTDVSDGYLHYNALDLNISHRFSTGLQMLASYTWSRTLDNVDPTPPARTPTAPTSPSARSTVPRFTISVIASSSAAFTSSLWPKFTSAV